MHKNSKNVDPAFGQVEILEQRKAEQVLRETEERVRSVAQRQGVKPVDGEDTSFEIKASAETVESLEDLEQYFEGIKGLSSADIVFYGESQQRRHGTQELSEDIAVRVDFPDQRFRDVYQMLEKDFGVQRVQFYMTGSGEDSVEAFRDTLPVLDVRTGDLGDAKGVYVSYRNGGTVEAMWSEKEDIKEVYDSLQGLGLGYYGAVVTGEQDSEWVIAENPYDDFSDM